jgi:hypothetical protein
MTTPPVGLSNSPFYLRPHQNWAIEQERYRHNQALYSVGEMVMFVLMWHVEDHLKGYVRRCPRCFNGDDARAAKVYEQSTVNKCPMCYGTTFEGGVRAKIIRPAIITDSDDNEIQGERGVTFPVKVTVESVSDFRFRNGDYLFRQDGSRYQLGNPQRTQLRTGFEHPSQAADSIGYAMGTATLENSTTVAWMISPTQDELQDLLRTSGRYPVQATDVTNGPLIPEGFVD